MKSSVARGGQGWHSHAAVRSSLFARRMTGEGDGGRPCQQCEAARTLSTRSARNSHLQLHSRRVHVKTLGHWIQCSSIDSYDISNNRFRKMINRLGPIITWPGWILHLGKQIYCSTVFLDLNVRAAIAQLCSKSKTYRSYVCKSHLHIKSYRLYILI